jgi:triosephosphate isomerase
MRKKIVAGNWKMNKTSEEAKELMLSLNRFVQTHSKNCEIIIAPPALFLSTVHDVFFSKGVKAAAQDMSEHLEGAYTGEISAKMIKSLDVDYVILGHSERRQYHGENDIALAKKVKIALEYGLIPIYCCGETLQEREAGNEFAVNKKQIETALFGLTASEIEKVVIAYEPVWAIGTGKTASPEQAQEIHHYIRSLIAEKYTVEIADTIPILYGGSVNAGNAREIFSKDDVDGGLVGGASLKESDFTTIIKAFD